MHDPELIVRTGGERRLSNYLLWQAAYSELVFREELWPDFSRSSLEAAIEEFRRRADGAAGRRWLASVGRALAQRAGTLREALSGH